MSEGIYSAPSIAAASVPTPPSPLYTLFWDASNGNAPSIKAHTTGTVTAFGGLTVQQVQDILVDSGEIDVTDLGTTSSFSLLANSVVLSKLQQITTDRLLGRDTAGTGNVEQLAVGNGLEFTGGPGIGVANAGVTNARLADMPTARFKGRTTAGTGVPEDLTSAQATALLDLAVAMGVKGLVTGSDKKRIDVANMYYDAVADVGIDPTGAASAVSLIQNWNNANTGGLTRILYVPPDCKVRMDGNVNLDTNVRVVGGHRRTSRIETAIATGNIFTVSSDAVTFENLRFSTPTDTNTRTSGFAVSFTSASDSSGVRNCDFLFQWSAIQLSGGLQFVDDCNIREYNSSASGGCCIQVDGAGDRYIRRLITDSTVPSAGGFAGVRVTVTASLVIADSNVIHAGNALDLAPANGITVPSVNCVNCFFDTSVVGLNCTGAGTVARSKFTHCWFGSMSDSGIKLGPTGTGNVDGLSFVNCEMLNNVGGTTVGVNVTTALVGEWKLVGCAVAGWTTGVVLIGGTNHFPLIEGCTIGSWGVFGVNTTGVNVATGTYKSLLILGNDCGDNTTALTLGTVTVGSFTRYRIQDNVAINPRGNAVTTPGVPTAGTTLTNQTGFRVHILAKHGATAPAATVVQGVSSGAGLVNELATIILDPGMTIAFTTTTVASWTWSGM